MSATEDELMQQIKDYCAQADKYAALCDDARRRLSTLQLTAAVTSYTAESDIEEDLPSPPASPVASLGVRLSIATGTPRSAAETVNSWIEVGNEHPNFLRLDPLSQQRLGGDDVRPRWGGGEESSKLITTWARFKHLASQAFAFGDKTVPLFSIARLFMRTTASLTANPVATRNGDIPYAFVLASKETYRHGGRRQTVTLALNSMYTQSSETTAALDQHWQQWRENNDLPKQATKTLTLAHLVAVNKLVYANTTLSAAMKKQFVELRNATCDTIAKFQLLTFAISGAVPSFELPGFPMLPQQLQPQRTQSVDYEYVCSCLDQDKSIAQIAGSPPALMKPRDAHGFRDAKLLTESNGILQQKHDGMRATLHIYSKGHVMLYTKKGKRSATLPGKYKTWVRNLEDALQQQVFMNSNACRDAIIDGEIVAYDRNGNEIAYSTALHGSTYTVAYVCFVAFDALRLDGVDYREEDAHVRYEALVQALASSTSGNPGHRLLDVSENFIGLSDDARAAIARANSYEGFVYKSGPYLPKRCPERQNNCVRFKERRTVFVQIEVSVGGIAEIVTEGVALYLNAGTFTTGLHIAVFDPNTYELSKPPTAVDALLATKLSVKTADAVANDPYYINYRPMFEALVDDSHPYYEYYLAYPQVHKQVIVKDSDRYAIIAAVNTALEIYPFYPETSTGRPIKTVSPDKYSFWAIAVPYVGGAETHTYKFRINRSSPPKLINYDARTKFVNIHGALDRKPPTSLLGGTHVVSYDNIDVLPPLHSPRAITVNSGYGMVNGVYFEASTDVKVTGTALADAKLITKEFTFTGPFIVVGIRKP